jgi:hypothetical protein
MVMLGEWEGVVQIYNIQTQKIMKCGRLGSHIRDIKSTKRQKGEYAFGTEKGLYFGNLDN